MTDAALTAIVSGIGLLIGMGNGWSRVRREERSEAAARVLDRIAFDEQGIAQVVALREALMLGPLGAGEWWRPAWGLVQDLRAAAEVCGDARLAELPATVAIDDVLGAAARARAALQAELLPPPRPEAPAIVYVRRSGTPAGAR